MQGHCTPVLFVDIFFFECFADGDNSASLSRQFHWFDPSEL